MRRLLAVVNHDELLSKAFEDNVYLVDAVVRVHFLPVRVKLLPLCWAHYEVVHAHAFCLRVSLYRVIYGLPVVEVYLQNHAPTREQLSVYF